MVWLLRNVSSEAREIPHRYCWHHTWSKSSSSHHYSCSGPTPTWLGHSLLLVFPHCFYLTAADYVRETVSKTLKHFQSFQVLMAINRSLIDHPHPPQNDNNAHSSWALVNKGETRWRQQQSYFFYLFSHSTAATLHWYLHPLCSWSFIKQCQDVIRIPWQINLANLLNRLPSEFTRQYCGLLSS